MSKPAKKQSLTQTEPEDFSADEKEAAQAVINNANKKALDKGEHDLEHAIKDNTKDQQDFIDSFRDLSSGEVQPTQAKVLKEAKKENDDKAKKL